MLTQVLLELGSVWEAVRAAGRAVQLMPEWADAHVTLARAQLNFGEVCRVGGDMAGSSFQEPKRNDQANRGAQVWVQVWAR